MPSSWEPCGIGQLLAMRDTLYLQDEIPDKALDEKLPPYYRPEDGSEIHEYLMTRRRALAGSLPRRLPRVEGHASRQAHDRLGHAGGDESSAGGADHRGLLAPSALT